MSLYGTHRFNMELDLQSFFGLHVHCCILIGGNPATPPFPSHLGSYTRALLVSQDRRLLYFFLLPPDGTEWKEHGFGLSIVYIVSLKILSSQSSHLTVEPKPRHPAI
jgi:hypothetical protein